MSRASQLIGKTFDHPDLGLVIVDSAASRVKVNITCIDRGTYDEITRTYRKIKRTRPNVDAGGRPVGTTVYWTHFKSTTQYGHKDVCHVDSLKPIT